MTIGDQTVKPVAFYHLNGTVVQNLSVVSEGQPLRKPIKLFEFIRLVGYSLPDKTIKDVTSKKIVRITRPSSQKTRYSRFL